VKTPLHTTEPAALLPEGILASENSWRARCSQRTPVSSQDPGNSIPSIAYTVHECVWDSKTAHGYLSASHGHGKTSKQRRRITELSAEYDLW